MKYLIRKIFLIGFPSVLIFYAIFKLAFKFLFHKDLIDLVEITVESLIFALVFTLFQGFLLIQFFKPKILFLKSDSPIEKRFGNIKTNVKVNRIHFDFQDFVKSLKHSFVITYSDENKNIIKVRDRFRFWSWGAAAMIDIDIENNDLKISAFPFSGTGNKTSIRLIEKIIKTTTA